MDHRALVQRFTDLCNSHDVTGFGEVIDVDYRQHNPMVADGLAGITQGFADFLTVFPDLRASLEAVVAQGDLVAARFEWQGTQAADFLGIPTSGRSARWASIDWWRVDGGKLAEHWDVVDWAGLTMQLAGPSTNVASTAQGEPA